MRGKRSEATLSPPIFVVQIGRSNCFSNNRENSWLEALYCFSPWLGDVICTIWSQRSALAVIGLQDYFFPILQMIYQSWGPYGRQTH